MASSPATVAEPESFEERLVALLAKQPRRMFVALLLALVLIAGMASRTTPLRWVLVWLAFATFVLLFRVFAQSPARLSSFSPKARLRITVALVGLSSSTHGLSLFFFPAMSPFEQAVLSMMLVGLAAGSVATAAGYRPIFLAYIVPTLGPLAVLWAVSPGLRAVGWVHGLMALLIVLFAFVLHALARDTFHVLRESYEIRLERAALNRELRSALEGAEAANRAKTRFLASASHDLRQPMQTLSLFAAALAMRPLDERSKTIVAHINDALHDLTGELDALLDVSKLDAGTVKPQADAFALQPLLLRIVGVFRSAAEEKGLQMSLHCDEKTSVLTDRKLLERVIRNLVENAVKYTEAGHIAIEVTAAPQGSCTLSVTDTGCGIAEAEQARVFEEFYQVHNPERDRKRGLGLGLAIVKRLVNLLHLQLSMTSAPERGTRFEIVIPLAPAETAQRGVPRDESPAPSPAIRVLLIDDEESLRRAMRALLEETGSAVELASSTDEAAAILAKITVDLLIADFRLRGEDNGIKAIKVLRCIQPDLPALLMTGETAPERLREAEEAGIPVIHKPVMPHLLLREISKIMPGRTGSEVNGERYGGVG